MSRHGYMLSHVDKHNWRCPHHWCGTMGPPKRPREEKTLKARCYDDSQILQQKSQGKIRGRGKGLVSWFGVTRSSLNAKKSKHKKHFKKIRKVPKVGCHSMSSLSPPSGKDISEYVPPSSSHLQLYDLHLREKGILLATDLLSVKSVFQVGCDHSALTVLSNRGWKSWTSPWLSSTWIYGTCASLPPTSSPPAKLIKSSIFFKITDVASSTKFSLILPRKSSNSILSSAHTLYALPSVHLISCITCIYLHDCLHLLSQGSKLCPCQLCWFRTVVFHPKLTMKPPGEL